MNDEVKRLQSELTELRKKQAQHERFSRVMREEQYELQTELFLCMRNKMTHATELLKTKLKDNLRAVTETNVKIDELSHQIKEQHFYLNKQASE